MQDKVLDLHVHVGLCRNKAKAKWVDVEEDQNGDQCHMIATIGRRQLPRPHWWLRFVSMN